MEKEELIPLSDYCNWLEVLTERGEIICAKGLQLNIEKYIKQALTKKQK